MEPIEAYLAEDPPQLQFVFLEADWCRLDTSQHFPTNEEVRWPSRIIYQSRLQRAEILSPIIGASVSDDTSHRGLRALSKLTTMLMSFALHLASSFKICSSCMMHI